MRLRQPAESDLETIRQLRNANRQCFFYDREVTPEQHVAWFHALPIKPIDFYVIEEAGTVVGTISATRSPNGIEIGNLVLADAARGKGLMRQAVRDLTTAPGHYFARVKAGNTQSINVFLATGFARESLADAVILSKTVGQ